MHGWPRKKYTLVAIVTLIIYILIVPNEYTVQFDTNINGVEAVIIWEFVADFNNMKKLNPTIINFTITYDYGSYDNWQYGVYYTEYLSTIPLIKNSADGHYQVKKLQDKSYAIYSNHKTCFIGNIYCLKSNSSFTFNEEISAIIRTYIQETITYECPRILSKLCHNEVMFQRKHIFNNLKRILSKN
ncbi:hypothetical protein O3M35_013206 [Rhynocoris fuscipes]|uniref:Uncharacterized protein n=1 Tax=Rhynocoris fuscipes TaxID=488301 RepID=A0AAW1CJ95_9HEMI